MSKVGFWLKGSTGKLAGTTLYKGANGETIQREIVSPSNPKTISTATVNNQAMTVGSPKTVYLSEGESTIDLDIRVTFANVGNASAVGLFKGTEQVGTDHAISGTGCNFTAAAQSAGNYNLKVKKSDNTWEQVSYYISVQTDGGMGQD